MSFLKFPTMRNVLLLSLAVTICGCAAPNELRKKGPSLSEISNKSSDKIAPCIADGWDSLPYLSRSTSIPVSTKKTSNGASLSIVVHNVFETWVGAVVDIEDTQTGSVIRFYNSSIILSGPYEDAIRKCL